MHNESEKFIKLAVKDLARKIICDGHLYLSSGQRKFYLMKPGVFVDPAFVKKHAANNQVFDFSSVINPEVKERFKLLFRELRYLQFEKDLREKSFEILRYFFEVYSQPEHFLSFASACHEEFCKLPFEDQQKMHETDMHLYRKALYASAFSVIAGMTNDFFHFLMLRDFYNLTFSLDIGLCEDRYSYFVAQSCNEENKNPGQGRIHLANEKATESETAVFLNHPRRSYDFIKSTDLLAYPELAEIILYQHELSDGTGFPRGVMKGQVSSWEAVVIFSDSLVEILPEYEFESNVVSYLLEFNNKKLNDLPVGKVYRKLCLAFEHFKMLKETGS